MSHEHWSFLIQMCPLIPVDSGRFDRLLARGVTNCGQFNHRFYLRRLLSYTIFFTRPLPRPPKCVFKKKKNFVFSIFFFRFGARFSVFFFPVRVGYVAYVVRATPCWRVCLVSPCMRVCVGCPPRFCKSGELYHLRSLRICPSGVRWWLSARHGCELPYCPALAIPGFLRFRPPHLNRQLVVRHRGPYVHRSPGNFGAGAHCRPSLVRQFWGRCPLPSVTRQAILGQVPTAVLHSSGNFRAGAHCRPSLVRQFRGKRPLPSVTRQAISG